MTISRKFTPKGGRIEVLPEYAGEEARLTVRDTGIGIAADFLPHVFERFRQGSTGPSRQRSGLGLGLAIVKHLVDVHGGRITAESAGAGQGAVFVVHLPTVMAGATADNTTQPSEQARPDFCNAGDHERSTGLAD